MPWAIRWILHPCGVQHANPQIMTSLQNTFFLIFDQTQSRYFCHISVITFQINGKDEDVIFNQSGRIYISDKKKGQFCSILSNRSSYLTTNCGQHKCLLRCTKGFQLFYRKHGNVWDFAERNHDPSRILGFYEAFPHISHL